MDTGLEMKYIYILLILFIIDSCGTSQGDSCFEKENKNSKSSAESFSINSLDSFERSLSTEELIWWNNPKNGEKVKKIKTFFNEKGYSKATVSLVMDAIKVYQNDGKHLEGPDQPYDSVYWKSNPDFPSQELPLDNGSKKLPQER